MVKRTQTIRRQQPTTCLSVFDHFVGLVLKGLNFTMRSYFGLNSNRKILEVKVIVKMVTRSS